MEIQIDNYKTIRSTPFKSLFMRILFLAFGHSGFTDNLSVTLVHQLDRNPYLVDRKSAQDQIGLPS